MLSRVADSILWMSRYIERAENVARFIDVNQKLTLGFQRGLQTQWEPLIHTTGDEELFQELYGDYTQENVVKFLTFEDRNPNSIFSCLKFARENARCVRENLSIAIWEAINKFYLIVKEFPRDHIVLQHPHRLLDVVKQQSQLIVGAAETTLSHGDAWNYSRLGRFIERGDKTSRILDVKYYILLPTVHEVGGSLDIIQWSALLNSTSGLQMYRRKWGRIHPKKVVEFLVLDRYFPRSMHYCLIHADESLRTLSGAQPYAFSNPAEQLLGRMKTSMDYLSVDDIINQGLHEYIDTYQRQLNDLGKTIDDVIFNSHQSQQSSEMQYQRQG